MISPTVSLMAETPKARLIRRAHAYNAIQVTP